MVAGQAGTTAARGALPRGLHVARSPVSPDAVSSPAALRPALSGRVANLVDVGRRQQTAGGADRSYGHLAHLGAKPVVSPTPALRGHRRRPESRWQPLGRRPARLLAARQGSGTTIPWQISGRDPASLPGRATHAGWQRRQPGPAAGLSPLARYLVPSELGCLRQATFWRGPAGVSLSRPLFPPRGYCQFPLARAGEWPGLFPLEGLCRRPSYQGHAAERRRVYPTLPAAR